MSSGGIAPGSWLMLMHVGRGLCKVCGIAYGCKCTFLRAQLLLGYHEPRLGSCRGHIPWPGAMKQRQKGSCGCCLSAG